MRSLGVLLALLAVLLTVPACKKAPDAAVPSKPEVHAIHKAYERGPVRVSLSVDKDTVSIADRVTLTIAADAEEGTVVTLPSFGEKLGQFGIVDYREEQPRLTGDKRVRTAKIYTLEPFLSGEYPIAPMTVTFRKQSEPQEAAETSPDHRIETEELKITVTSLLGEDRGKLQIAPIFGPVALPMELPPLWLIALGILVLCLLAAGGFFMWKHTRRRTSAVEAERLSAHELAYRQLEALLSENLPERGEFKQFFLRISDVVRTYIENRFGLRAPKLTTEEFLATIGRDAPFSPGDRQLLDGFLRRCDLVKFAEHLPTAEEIRGAVEGCKAFIEATRSDAVVSEPGAGGTELSSGGASKP